MKHVLLTLFASVVFAAAMPSASWATTYYVNNLTDSPDDGDCGAHGACSLRDALGTAADGDTVQLPAGQILLTKSIVLKKSITIAGKGPRQSILKPAELVLPATQTYRVFEVAEGTKVTIADLSVEGTFTVADAGGLLANSGTLDIERCLFVNGRAKQGGALFNDVKAELRVKESLFLTNHAGTEGGAIASLGHLAMDNVTLASNIALADGGALYVGEGDAAIVASTFTGNGSKGKGGGIAISATALVTLDHALIVHNTATGAGQSLDCSGSVAQANATMMTSINGCVVVDGKVLKASGPAPVGVDQGGPINTYPFDAAVDAGDEKCPLSASAPDTIIGVDARGAQRPAIGSSGGIARCDIGAFEKATPNVQVTQAFSASNVGRNRQATLTIALTNPMAASNDTSSAAGLVLDDTLPSGVSNVTVDTGGQGKCDVNTEKLRCTLAPLPVDGSIKIVVTMTMSGPMGTATNTIVSLTSNERRDSWFAGPTSVMVLPMVGFPATALTIGENDSSPMVGATVSEPALQTAVTVTFAVIGGSATNGSDFVASASQEITIKTAVTLTAAATITVLFDEEAEADETFSVRIVSAKNAVIDEAARELTYTIRDTVKGLACPARAKEDTRLTCKFGLDMHLVREKPALHVALKEGTAGAADFQVVTPDLTVDATTGTGELSIDILADNAAETDETLQLALEYEDGQAFAPATDIVEVIIEDVTQVTAAQPATEQPTTEQPAPIAAAGSESDTSSDTLVDRLSEDTPAKKSGCNANGDMSSSVFALFFVATLAARRRTAALRQRG